MHWTLYFHVYLRKAFMSLQRQKSQPELVLDSVPIGGDEMETLPSMQSELDHLASEFENMDVEVPAAPTVTWHKHAHKSMSTFSIMLVLFGTNIPFPTPSPDHLN